MNLVLEDQYGVITVDVLLFDTGAGDEDNEMIQDILDGEPLDFGAVLSDYDDDDLENEWSYSYEGSLTHPPCTEGVFYGVHPEIQPISSAQLKQFTDKWAGNFTFANGRGNNRAT